MDYWWKSIVISLILLPMMIKSSVDPPPTPSPSDPEAENDYGGKKEERGQSSTTGGIYIENCGRKLLPGQYLCTDLNIDPETQQPFGCTPEGKARVPCVAVPGISCSETGNGTFYREISCLWTNGYKFDTALLFSIFLGMFGVDRFYLGYPAIGLFKFSTLGFFFLGHLLDIILIASQTVGPADGSHYVISYFGAGINVISTNNETVRRPRPDWY